MQFLLNTLIRWTDEKPWSLRFVAIATFVWLVVVLPFLTLYHNGVRPFYSPEKRGTQDLAQYYMGAVIVIEGAYESMYPTPGSNLTCNVGWPQSSTPKPGYTERTVARGVEDTNRYIMPPPSALLLAPLGLFSYQTARIIWVVLLGFSCWICCALGNHLAWLAGSSRLERIFWWGLWGFSPLMLKIVRVANCLPLAAVAFTMAVLAVYQKKAVTAVLGCISAVLLKGIGLIMIPFILTMRRWKIMFLGAALALMTNLITIAITGFDVYIEFLTKIYPSTRIPDPYNLNQTIYGFLHRLIGPSAFSSPIVDLIRISGQVLGLLVVLLIWKKRRIIQDNFTAYLAAVFSILGLYLIWSPYSWDHYLLLYVPFLTVLWHNSKTWQMRIAVAAGTLLIWLPLATIRNGMLVKDEPWHSHLLFGQILLTAIAALQLLRTNPVKDNSNGT